MKNNYHEKQNIRNLLITILRLSSYKAHTVKKYKPQNKYSVACNTFLAYHVNMDIYRYVILPAMTNLKRVISKHLTPKHLFMPCIM